MGEAENKREIYRPGWDREFGRIGIHMGPAVVHVDNDQVLKECMGLHLSKAIPLAEMIQDMYLKEYETPLQISSLSLAVELTGHFLIQEICLGMKKMTGNLPFRGPLTKLCDSLLFHMSVIDCGEKQCDNNRFLWDMIAGSIGVIQKIRRKR